MNYRIIAIRDYLSNETLLNTIFERFSCPNNIDIEIFLKNRAIDFEKKHFSRTYLVVGDTSELLGYFSLAVKALNLRSGISNRLKKLVSGYSNKPDSAVYLIGQLAKNSATVEQNPLEGHILISLALKYINKANELVGGRGIMVECDNIKPLIDFYENVGFQRLLSPVEESEQRLTYILGIDKLH